MPTIIALATPDGNISMTPYQDATKRDFARKNPGRVRITLERVTPESRNQRKFYHGAILPLIAYYQEGMDHRNYNDLDTLHTWLKTDLNGEFITIKGKSIKVPKSTKGELNSYIERVMDWMGEQGYDTDLLNPEMYKDWYVKVFPYGGPENYIDYLVTLGKL